MDWNDRLSAYWVGLWEARARLAIDAEALRCAEESGCSLDQHFIGLESEEREGIIYRRHMEAQRIARMGREFHGFLHLPTEVERSSMSTS